MPTYYESLGVRDDATDEDIKNAFRRLAKKYHPDVNKSANAQQMFCDVYAAYEILADATKRKKYDAYLTNLARPKPPPSMQEEQEEIRTWQTQAESKGQTYADMPYKEFVSKVLDTMGAVAVCGFGVYMIFGLVMGAIFLIAAPFVLGPGGLLLWVGAYFYWKALNKP